MTGCNGGAVENKALRRGRVEHEFPPRGAVWQRHYHPTEGPSDGHRRIRPGAYGQPLSGEHQASRVMRVQARAREPRFVLCLLLGLLMTGLAGNPMLARDTKGTIARALMPKAQRSGALLWQSPVGGDRFSGLVYSDKRLFVTTQHVRGDGAFLNSHLLALDVKGGRVKWSIEKKAPLSRPLVVGEKLIVADEAGNVSAIDVRSSAERWSTPLGELTHLTPVVLGVADASQERVIVATDKSIQALQLSTGQRLWRQELTAPVQFIAATSVQGGTVIEVLADGSLTAVDARDGKPRWSAAEKVHGRALAALSGEWLVVGGREDQVYGIRLTTGATVWTARLSAPLSSAPLVDSGFVALPLTDHTVTVLKLDSGKSLWGYKQEESVNPLLLAAESTLVVKSGPSLISLMDLGTGRLLWKLQTDKPVLNLPAATDDGLIYFLTAGGMLYAAGGPDYNGPPDPDERLLSTP